MPTGKSPRESSRMAGADSLRVRLSSRRSPGSSSVPSRGRLRGAPSVPVLADDEWALRSVELAGSTVIDEGYMVLPEGYMVDGGPIAQSGGTGIDEMPRLRVASGWPPATATKFSSSPSAGPPPGDVCPGAESGRMEGYMAHRQRSPYTPPFEIRSSRRAPARQHPYPLWGRSSDAEKPARSTYLQLRPATAPLWLPTEARSRACDCPLWHSANAPLWLAQPPRPFSPRRSPLTAWSATVDALLPSPLLECLSIP